MGWLESSSTHLFHQLLHTMAHLTTNGPSPSTGAAMDDSGYFSFENSFGGDEEASTGHPLDDRPFYSEDSDDEPLTSHHPDGRSPSGNNNDLTSHHPDGRSLSSTPFGTPSLHSYHRVEGSTYGPDNNIETGVHSDGEVSDNEGTCEMITEADYCVIELPLTFCGNQIWTTTPK